ncbi:MAG: hypothetical protein ACTS73_02765 [Arsenophonus sp. NEOnobi-MAG3]
MTLARFWKVNSFGGKLKLLIEVSVNGARNYNGYKVAKCLIG